MSHSQMLTGFPGRERQASINQVLSIIIIIITISFSALLKEGKINLAGEIFVNRRNVVGSRSRRKKKKKANVISEPDSYVSQTKTNPRPGLEIYISRLKKNWEPNGNVFGFPENYEDIWRLICSDEAVFLCDQALGERKKREKPAKRECVWSVFTLQSANLLLTFSMA